MTNVNHHQRDCPGLIALIATARCPVCIDCTIASPPSGFIVFHAYWHIGKTLIGYSSVSWVIFHGGSGDTETTGWKFGDCIQAYVSLSKSNFHLHISFVKINFRIRKFCQDLVTQWEVRLRGARGVWKWWRVLGVRLWGVNKDRDVFWMPVNGQIIGWSWIQSWGDKGAFMYIFERRQRR